MQAKKSILDVFNVESLILEIRGHKVMLDSSLRSQIATSRLGHGGRRYPPYVFTEHGAIMLASVLNTARAIDASIYVVRAFVRMRELIGTQKVVAEKLTELERRIGSHDEDIRNIVAAIRQLMTPPSAKKKQIGFDR